MKIWMMGIAFAMTSTFAHARAVIPSMPYCPLMWTKHATCIKKSGSGPERLSVCSRSENSEDIYVTYAKGFKIEARYLVTHKIVRAGPTEYQYQLPNQTKFSAFVSVIGPYPSATLREHMADGQTKDVGTYTCPKR